MRIHPALALAIGLGLASPVLSGDVEEGREIFIDHCAACHGLDAVGNGPMAAILTVQPTNLAELAKRNGNEFPTARVVMRIDGRDPLVAHGSPMPVFGDFFEGRTDSLKTASGQPILTSAPVVDLVAYLETLQVE